MADNRGYAIGCAAALNIGMPLESRKGRQELIKNEHLLTIESLAELLIESDRLIAARLNVATGRVEVTDLSDPHVDDLLDDLGELVGKMGGRVLVMPAERMPVRTGLAGIYRY